MPMIQFFFFNDTAATEIYTLSLHDALPILKRTPFEQLRGRLRARGHAGLAVADVEPHVDVRHPLDLPHGLLGVALARGADGRILGLKLDGEGHAAAADREVAHEAERDDVAGKAGELNGFERVEHLLLRCHSFSPV